MKAFPKKLLPLTLFGIAITSLFSVQPAKAFMVTLEQVGSNVVATGSGAFNLTGLTPGFRGFSTFASMQPSISALVVADGTDLIGYTGFSGPSSFGPGSFVNASSNIGDPVGIRNDPLNRGIFLPAGYVSNAPLSDSMTFNNATFASLGVTPGTYVWTWGTGLANQTNQNFTLIIGRATVPDAGSTVSLLGFVLFGLAALRRKLGC